MKLLNKPATDQGPEHQSPGPERQIQATRPEESPSLRWRHPALSAGLQTQGVHGPESKPQVRQEGRHREGGLGVDGVHLGWNERLKVTHTCITCDIILFCICVCRKRQWRSVTGGKTWRPCLEWKEGRKCLMQHSKRMNAINICQHASVNKRKSSGHEVKIDHIYLLS